MEAGAGDAGRVRVAPLAAAILVCVAAAWWVTGRLAGGELDAPAADEPAFQGFACVRMEGEPDYCDTMADEWARRTRVPPGREDAVRAYLGPKIEHTVSDGAWCGGPCLPAHERRPPAAADVDTVRAALAGLGFPDAVVRLARERDPAPPGSLLYAVRVETACVVGHVTAVPGPGRQSVLGLLPGGACLDP